MRPVAKTLLFALLLSCGDAAEPVGEPVADEVEREPRMKSCVDEDGDGHGRNCDPGPDCDDDDESIFESCVCKAVRQDCACEPDSSPVECELDTEQVLAKSPLCKTGLRYCRDGFWTECVGLAAMPR